MKLALNYDEERPTPFKKALETFTPSSLVDCYSVLNMGGLGAGFITFAGLAYIAQLLYVGDREWRDFLLDELRFKSNLGASQDMKILIKATVMLKRKEKR